MGGLSRSGSITAPQAGKAGVRHDSLSSAAKRDLPAGHSLCRILQKVTQRNWQTRLSALQGRRPLSLVHLPTVNRVSYPGGRKEDKAWKTREREATVSSRDRRCAEDRHRNAPRVRQMVRLYLLRGSRCAGRKRPIYGLRSWAEQLSHHFGRSGREAARAYEKKGNRVRREQRRLSRKKKGSNNRRKQQTRLARAHERVAKQRRDFLHKASRRMVDSYEGFAFENLRVKNLLKNHKLARAIADAGWSTFIDMMAYKAERAGKPFVLVDARNTSQTCSRCGTFVPKNLSVRIHQCPECVVRLDRDHNAAMNVLSRAGTARSHARGEVTAVNGGFYSQVTSTKREAPSTEAG